MEYLTLEGSCALSEFRLRALARDMGAEKITARHMHYVALKGDLDENDRQILDQLLDYGEPPGEDDEDLDIEGNTTFFVSPRLGTFSPWVCSAINQYSSCSFQETGDV